MSRKLTGYVLVVTAFLACPCHLLLTLPVAVAVLGGTAWGIFLSENTVLIYGLATAYFVFALLGGMRLVSRSKAKRADCEDCKTFPEGERERGRA